MEQIKVSLHTAQDYCSLCWQVNIRTYGTDEGQPAQEHCPLSWQVNFKLEQLSDQTEHMKVSPRTLFLMLAGKFSYRTAIRTYGLHTVDVGR